MTREKRIEIISSVICLLPIALGVTLYPSLPDKIAVHWSGGVADNFLPKWAVVFILPVAFCALHIFSVIKRQNDPSRAGHSSTMRAILYWVIPAIAVILMPATYMLALGIPIPIDALVYSVAGLVFIVLGNYLPKNRRNYSIGIKLPWTLYDDTIWNKTHRLTGWLYVLGGIAVILQGFLLGSHRAVGIPVAVCIVLLLFIAPRLYAFYLYRRQQAHHFGKS